MASQSFEAENFNDATGKPAGGWAGGAGFRINWQNGPLGVCNCPRQRDPINWPLHAESCPRQEPNGAFVETIIAAVIQRIEYYQSSEFACRENALALTKFQEGLHWLEHRTNDRIKRGVEGSHEK